MIGWWEELEQGHEHLPVTSNVETVKVTTYLRKVTQSQTLCIDSGFSHLKYRDIIAGTLCPDRAGKLRRCPGLCRAFFQLETARCV